VNEFVNADTIAQGLSAYRPESAAIAAGRVAASSIDKYLGGSGDIDEELTRERKIGLCTGITVEDFHGQRRVKMPVLPPNEVTGNFAEVELGLFNDDAVAEGRRCFQCGFRSQISPAPRPPAAEKHPAGKPDIVEAAV